MYSIYSYCLYDSNTSTVYGYISSYKSNTLKFEPTKKGIYDFTVTVTNSATLKSLSKIIPVTVQ
ncbi:hypothetical protein GW830_04850 [bacterium]|nr:hypothetical protein [bacterium]